MTLHESAFINLFRYCDEGMIEAVTTLMWSAPRLQSDVQELRVVSYSLKFVIFTNNLIVLSFYSLKGGPS